MIFKPYQFKIVTDSSVVLFKIKPGVRLLYCAEAILEIVFINFFPLQKYFIMIVFKNCQ